MPPDETAVLRRYAVRAMLNAVRQVRRRVVPQTSHEPS
jgi:hypothetical protein